MRLLLAATLALSPQILTAETRTLQPDDFHALKDVRDPRLSPDGAWVAYTVRTPDRERDRTSGDLWMSPVAGGEPLQLTRGKGSESHARFSPDGRFVAFLAEDEKEIAQVFLLDRRGGEPAPLTSYEGGVSDFAWSPDSRRLALIVSDPDPRAAKKEEGKEKKAEPPIVIRRLKFKEDGTGYLTEARSHLNVFEVEKREGFALGSGAFDESSPAWSPDGRSIAFVSNRTPEPDGNENTDVFVVEAREGAAIRQLTTSPGTAAAPAWSPDGAWIAFVEGGADPKDVVYTANHLALVRVADGHSRVLTPSLDRNVETPRFTPDGRAVTFLVEEGGNVHLAQVPVAGGTAARVVDGERVVVAYDADAKGTLVVLESQPAYPPEISAVAPGGLRRVTHVNDAFLEGIRLGPVEHRHAKSPDGTRVDYFLFLPPGYVHGARVPTLLRPHGGPPEQTQSEFDMERQLFAAHGYAVVAPNYRGSTGSGAAFSHAIWRAWGTRDLEDCLAALDDAVAAGFADPERLAVGGWSYSGMLTDYIVTRSDRFKVAFSGASEANYLMDYGVDDLHTWWETELGLPWKERALWLELSPFFAIERVKTPTLVVCGQLDMRVPLVNSEQLYMALRRLGVETELVIYPGEYHSFRRPSHLKDRAERYFAWLDRFIPPR